MKKDERKRENSAKRNSITRSSVTNEKRKENNFNTRNRDYENYYEFADESTVDPLDTPMTGANEIRNANQMSPNSLNFNPEKRKKNRSADRYLDD